jgi:arsenite-transporting ATPase
MRVLLFTGKGGVGKTTVAAATAIQAARCGIKTLVLSTDTAHSLADAFGCPAGDTPVEVQAGLFVVQVDARARAERSWREVQEYLIGVLDGFGVDPLDADELTRLPAAEEVLALLELRDQVERGPWDLVVVDCAPTAETLRLLAVPELLARVLGGMLPIERRLARAMARRLPAVPDHLVLAAERLTAELGAARDVLHAPGTSIRLVLTPESVVAAESRRTWTALSMHGFRVDAVVANRVIPTGTDPWLAGWVRDQQEVLAGIETSFEPLPVRRVGYGAGEPVGLDALAAVGEQLYGPPGTQAGERLLAAPDVVEPLAVERDGTGYALRLRLPLVTRDEVSLARQGDELIVEVAGRRRVLALPSALRRCVVVGARLRDGWLRVAFEPDPALWRPL